MEQNISEMSKDKLESLVKHMEETLSEMEQLKLHCGKQSEELSQLVVELRRENQELVEKYNQLAAEMKEAKEIIEQLQDTKYAFNAKERQAQKLSRQLWRPTGTMEKPSPAGGSCLGVVKFGSWRKTRLAKADEENGLLQNMSKHWVGMKAKLGTAVFFNIDRGLFLPACVYVLGPEGMDIKFSNLNVSLNPVA